MADFGRAQEEAEKVWREQCLTSLPFPILDVARSYGLSVYEIDLSDQPDISGILDIEKEIIYLNQTDSTAHKRFTIAHELGHWLLHKEDLKRDPNLTIYYRRPIAGETDDREKEANCFAASLLVPYRLLNPIKLMYTDLELAQMFAVSQQVIGYRKKSLSRFR